MSKRNIETFEDDTIYPPSASAQGDNAFYHLCEVMGQKCAYASCLKKIADRAHGRLETSFATCSAEIGKRTCPALQMKAQEAAAGKALFYVNRDKQRSIFFALSKDIVVTVSKVVSKRNWNKAPEVPVPPPTITKALPAVPQGNDYAAAINAVLAQQSSRPVTTINAQVPIRAGMSMLEIARARMATT